MRGGLRETQAGVWEARVEAGRDPVTGRRRQVSRTVRGTKREAQKVLNALVADADQGRQAGTSASFKELSERWLELVDTDLSPTTLRRYRNLLSKRILPAIGALPVKSIRTIDLDQLYLGLSREVGLAPATVRQVHAVIRRAFGQAVRWGWVATNPAANASPPRLTSSGIFPPDVEQVVALLAKANETDRTLGRFLHVAVATGARRGEVCALRWQDLDVGNRTITISRSIAAVEGGLMEKSTKSHAARRIALHPDTLVILQAQRDDAEALAKAAETKLLNAAFIFSPDPDGKRPVDPGSITKRFQKLRGSLGLDTVRLHDLRHFAATRLLAAGVPVRTVSGRLGHANAATTLVVYGHFLEAADQAAADVMGDLIAGRTQDR